MSCCFTRVFAYLPVIVAVYYFSVHILIGWDTAKIYLFKFNSRNTRKRYEICPKLTMNATKSRSDVFTVKCYYCWLWIGKCLSRSSFLCKYYYSKSKDEQMLYLTIQSILIHEHQHESTRINTSPTWVNTNQHESDTSPWRFNTSPTQVNSYQHESARVWHESARINTSPT